MRFERSWRGARVRAVRPLPGDVRMIEIEPEGGARSYPPGSHIEVMAQIDGEREVRPYSLVGDGPVDGAYRIAVKHHPDGRGGSDYVRDLEPGAQLPVSDPQNLFPLAYGGTEYLLVAGGIGITPIVGMAHVLARRDEPFRLLYAGRRRADMPFVDELSERLGDRLRLCVSEEGTRMEVAAEIAALDPAGELYVCGPHRLIDECRRAWAAASRLRVNCGSRRSPPAASSHPSGSSCTCDHERRGRGARAGRCWRRWSRPGYAVMSDCLRGECGICTVRCSRRTARSTTATSSCRCRAGGGRQDLHLRVPRGGRSL